LPRGKAKVPSRGEQAVFQRVSDFSRQGQRADVLTNFCTEQTLRYR